VTSMSQSGKYTINEIGETLHLGRKTVRTILQRHEKGQSFISAAEKCKETCKQKNLTYNEVEQTMYNAVACNNSLIQKELQDIVHENLNVSISQAAVSKKL